MSDWQHHQEWELNWHLTYPFHYHEQVKQEVYAEKMGLERDYPDMDLKGQKILDVGAGPVSMLLKYHNYKDSIVADPLMDRFPEWVRMRYKDAGLTPIAIKGEDLDLTGFDIGLLYNVLQHVIQPEIIIANLRRATKILYVFEWINMPPVEGHPHELKADLLNEWLGGYGKTDVLNGQGCRGEAYFGCFRGT